MSRGASAQHGIEKLSARERDCLRLVYAHHTSKSIANELGFAKSSVDTYINRACTKLGLNDRKEAARLLHEHDLAIGALTHQPVEGAPAHDIVAAEDEDRSTSAPVDLSGAVEAPTSAVRQWLLLAFYFVLASGLMAIVLRVVQKAPLLAHGVLPGQLIAGAMSMILIATLLRALVSGGMSERAAPGIVAAGAVASILAAGYGGLHFAIDVAGALFTAWLARRDRRIWVLMFAGLSWASAAVGAAHLLGSPGPAGSSQLAFVTVYNLLGFGCVIVAAYGVWFASKSFPSATSSKQLNARADS